MVLGIALMIAAPLLRRFQRRSPALAAGASTVLAVAVVGLAHTDPRIGFFVTHFFTVKDQEKSKDFYVRILGGRVIKPDNPWYSFLNLRVADIWSCYKEWRAKGAFFLTEPLDNHGREWRCYMRDPDGYLIEVGQYTQMALERFKSYAS